MHTWYQQYYTKWNGMHIPRANFISFHISTCNHFKRFYWHFSVNVNFHGINMTAPKFIFASHILKLYVMRSLSVSVSHTHTHIHPLQWVLAAMANRIFIFMHFYEEWWFREMRKMEPYVLQLENIIALKGRARTYRWALGLNHVYNADAGGQCAMHVGSDESSSENFEHMKNWFCITVKRWVCMCARLSSSRRETIKHTIIFQDDAE